MSRRRAVDGPAARPVSMRAVAVASFSGAFLEWYDFNLYGISAALVLNKLFFTGGDAASTLASLATIGAGFVLRPIGGIVFGHLGDRIGRKATLITTMTIIGAATFLVGVLPTYDTAGLWAPVLLVLLRLLQGLGLGGEYGGASLLAVEYSPRNRRGLWGSLPQLGAPAGFLIATAAFSVSAALTGDHFITWGWRIPYLLSAVMLAAGLFVRLRIMETPAFRRVRASGEQAKIPFWTLVRRYPKITVLTYGARLAEGGSSQIFQPFAIAYVSTQLDLGRGLALTGVAVYNILGLLLTPLIGAWSDRIGRKRLYLTGAAFVGVFAFPFVWLLGTREAIVIVVAMGLASGGAIFMGGVQATFFTELFGTRVRYSGLSVAYQLSALTTGFIPAIVTSAIIAAGGSPWPAALITVGLAVVSLLCVLGLSETYRTDTSEIEQAEASGGTSSGLRADRTGGEP